VKQEHHNVTYLKSIPYRKCGPDNINDLHLAIQTRVVLGFELFRCSSLQMQHGLQIPQHYLLVHTQSSSRFSADEVYGKSVLKYFEK
jgi:hypothetical protein